MVTFFFWQREGYQEAKRALRATLAFCDADDVLTAWRVANPGVSIGLSTQGRALVLRCIDTWEDFLTTHPTYHDFGEHLRFLYSLLDDVGPPPPGKSQRPSCIKRLAHAGRFVCSK